MVSLKMMPKVLLKVQEARKKNNSLTLKILEAFSILFLDSYKA
jgi:hypothetical protein